MMEILGLLLLTQRLEEPKDFYVRTLNLPKVAQEQFASLKDRLSQRVTLLKRQGQAVFKTTVQRSLPDQTATVSNPLSILSVSEVGMAVDDVGSIAQLLQASLGVGVYANNPGLSAAVGDEAGMFIVVRRGQTWFPTDHLRAEAHPLHVTLAGTVYATDTLADYPYYIQTAKTSSGKRST